MQNRVQIAFIAIRRIDKEEFVRFIVVRNHVNCAILFHFIFRNPVINGKANVSTANVTINLKMEKDILEFTDSYPNKGYPGLYRAFNILYTACHRLIISQNFMKCKHNIKKTIKK